MDNSKMAENNTSAEYNLDENSDSEVYKSKSEDIGDNWVISTRFWSPLFQYWSFISGGLVTFLVIILILGMNGIITDLTLLMILLSVLMQTFLTGQLTSLI